MQRLFWSLVLVGLVWIVGLAAFIASLPAPSAGPPERADGVVVYTGGGGARISAGMDILADGGAERMLISGVHADTTRAALAELWDGPAPLFECCIDLGFDAQTTVGNADEAARWAIEHKAKRLVLVTSDYHMPRALAETRAKLPDTEITPYVVASGFLDEDGRPDSAQAWRQLAGEYMKFLLAHVKRFAAKLGL